MTSAGNQPYKQPRTKAHFTSGNEMRLRTKLTYKVILTALRVTEVVKNNRKLYTNRSMNFASVINCKIVALRESTFGK